jgi:TonB family protein
MRGGVAIHASRDVGVPFAIGFARPLIVVPAVFAARASEEFECIVLHELAHVRRRDAYGNACDRLMQALFYFNPAVLLILRAIALEREVACDDLAVAQSRDLATYTSSLASYAPRGAHAGCGVATAASGFGRATLTRIRRLEDARRNGATALSYNAIGGLTLVIFAIALTLQTFGPAVAFAAPAPLSRATIASTACANSDARYINGPAPERTRQLPNGLKTMVRVQVSSTGKVMGATILKASGNAGFDQAVIAAAKKGVYAPQTRHCRPLAGSYVFYAMTA